MGKGLSSVLEHSGGSSFNPRHLRLKGSPLEGDVKDQSLEKGCVDNNDPEGLT